jgi:hypothetical protein
LQNGAPTIAKLLAESYVTSRERDDTPSDPHQSQVGRVVAAHHRSTAPLTRRYVGVCLSPKISRQFGVSTDALYRHDIRPQTLRAVNEQREDAAEAHVGSLALDARRLRA